MPTTPAEPVADHISYDGCQGYRRGYDGCIQKITAGDSKGIPHHRYCIDTRNEEQTIPRKEKAYKKPCLGKDDKKNEPITS